MGASRIFPLEPAIIHVCTLGFERYIERWIRLIFVKIRPTDGNYALAQRLRKVIRRVLDYVLETKNDTTKSPNNEVPFDPMLTSFTEMDDLDWLNTIDWTQQASWMDFN